MNPDAIFVLIPITALMIPIVAIISRTVTKMIALKEKQLQVQTSMTAEKSAQYAAHTERLEARVRVLERIATDKGVDLSDEIERLRDTPLN
jgi:ABC-type phosphate transport system auxiliary subunit